MRNNPARIAWLILLTCFIVFCLLALSIPLALRWTVLHSQVDQSVLVRVTSGTVLLQSNAESEPIALMDARTVEPGASIKTDPRSQAALIFQATTGNDQPGPEIATVQIYPAADVQIAQASRPRFGASSDPNLYDLRVNSGRVRIYVADVQPNGQRFRVTTPHGQATLAPGSYAVQVDSSQTQIVTRSGSALVEADGRAVLVPEDTSATLSASQGLSGPNAAAENLIANGDFQAPLGPPTWLVTKYPVDDPTAGQAELVTVNGRSAARLSRINQPPTHSEVAITQVLGRSVHDYETLILAMDVLLRWQSLPGAGEQSSEFPLMFRLDYEDIYGNHQFWTHGFYYQDPPAQWVVTGGQKIPQNTWFPFESGNLLERLKEEGLPRPATLNYLKIYASGHNYDSLVTEIGLIAR
ncbi:MAG: FecR domain-containing protein [Anaerolinea sp.]|nr:FecR domain-containing protein [Anaerolinea sp.]HRI57674.1 FecR domain-containing protein [Anaerolineae bacterium]